MSWDRHELPSLNLCRVSLPMGFRVCNAYSINSRTADIELFHLPQPIAVPISCNWISGLHNLQLYMYRKELRERIGRSWLRSQSCHFFFFYLLSPIVTCWTDLRVRTSDLYISEDHLIMFCWKKLMKVDGITADCFLMNHFRLWPVGQLIYKTLFLHISWMQLYILRVICLDCSSVIF